MTIESNFSTSTLSLSPCAAQPLSDQAIQDAFNPPLSSDPFDLNPHKQAVEKQCKAQVSHCLETIKFQSVSSQTLLQNHIRQLNGQKEQLLNFEKNFSSAQTIGNSSNWKQLEEKFTASSPSNFTLSPPPILSESLINTLSKAEECRQRESIAQHMAVAEMVNLADKAISIILSTAVEELVDNVKTVCRLHPITEKTCQHAEEVISVITHQASEVGTNILDTTKSTLKSHPSLVKLSLKMKETFNEITSNFNSNTNALPYILNQTFGISKEESENFANQVSAIAPALLPIGKLKALKNIKHTSNIKKASKATQVIPSTIAPAKAPQQIRIYKNASGNEPYSKWFTKLNAQDKEAVSKKIDLFRHQGGQIRAINHSYNPETKNLYEIKIKANTAFRIYFGKYSNQNIFLCAGTKDSQKQDILLAIRYWKDYLTKLKE